jgi:hypothetical protein
LKHIDLLARWGRGLQKNVNQTTRRKKLTEKKDESTEGAEDLETNDLKAILDRFKLQEPQLWSLKEGAQYLGLSHRTLYNKASLDRKTPGENPLPVKRMGRKLFFNNNALILWAKYQELDKLISKFKRKKKSSDKK